MFDDSLVRRVLCVDDDPGTLDVLRACLEQVGLDVTTATSAQRALARIADSGLPDVAVLDVRMPDVDGIELARRIAEFSDVPIVFLTVVADESLVVEGLDEFAEDWVLKPFRPAELAARVRRVLRRVPPVPRGQAQWIEAGSRLSLDVSQLRARVADRHVELTPTEAKLLHMLIRARGEVVRTDYLIGRLWPRDQAFEDTLRVHVYRLRRKLDAGGSGPSLIATERGVGYRVEVRQAPPAARSVVP